MTGQSRGAVDLLLAESLKELAEDHPIEKITIKEITDKAGVIRPTFYNHFQDKYELLEWIVMTELLEPIKPMLWNGMVTQALILLFSTIEKDRRFYMKACRLEGQNSFENITKECIKNVLFEVFCDKKAKAQKADSWLTPELVAEYHAQSLSFLVLRWMRAGMDASVQEMADTYDYMIRHSIEDILRDL